MAAQQAEDLRRFLMARASELRSDGRLLSVSLGRTIDRLGWVWLMGELWEAVCDMVRDGLLSEDEQLRINFPFAQRSVAEVQEPFLGTGEFAGLSLEHVEVIAPPDPFWQAYQASGDSGALGESWARTLRAINAPMTRDALKSRSDCDALVEDLFIRFGQRIAANPQRNECYGLAVVLRKI
jgi:hypothetical protein